MRSTRAVTLVTLVLLNVFTLAAASSVAVMLPPRLAALKVPSVVSQQVRSAGSVLSAPSAGTTLPMASDLRALLGKTLGGTLSGSQVKAVIADGSTGKVIYDDNGGTAATPASTTKLATAVASLAVLGPDATFTTKVVETSSGIVLVGGGDPALAVNGYPSSDYPRPATLAELASLTAAALKRQGRTRVQLYWDSSLYSGPMYAPGWTSSDVSTGNVTPIVSLEVDQGRLTTDGQPEDDDDATNTRPRTTQPVGAAVQAFAALLKDDGISPGATGSGVQAPASAPAIASVRSPTVAQLVQQMLTESNNVIAENLGRHVAIATGRPATFAGAAAAVTAELRKLGVTSGIQLVDTSGLSPEDGVAPLALVQTLEAATRQSRLRAAITGLPVAGFDGTLSVGQSFFGGIGGAARGVVRAKTGNLTAVATLAGQVIDRSGRVLIFAIMTGGYSSAMLQDAADAVDSAAAGLATCGCG